MKRLNLKRIESWICVSLYTTTAVANGVSSHLRQFLEVFITTVKSYTWILVIFISKFNSFRDVRGLWSLLLLIKVFLLGKRWLHLALWCRLKSTSPPFIANRTFYCWTLYFRICFIYLKFFRFPWRCIILLLILRNLLTVTARSR